VSTFRGNILSLSSGLNDESLEVGGFHISTLSLMMEAVRSHETLRPTEVPHDESMVMLFFYYLACFKTSRMLDPIDL
jgi:hypothetical protein